MNSPTATQHLIRQRDGSIVELFQASADGAPGRGAILLVHGNQGGSLLGAREAADAGMLHQFRAALDVTAAAVSQPGFGASDGPPDFCGPRTQRAIATALSFLRDQPGVDADRIVLFGNSRGATASAMVACEDDRLRGLILMSGAYDLREVYETAFAGLRHAIEREAGLSDAAFALRSPLLHAHGICCETLLLHGAHDDRAPAGQAERLRQTLSESGTPATLELYDCGHRIPRELRRDALRLFLRRMFNTLH